MLYLEVVVVAVDHLPDTQRMGWQEMLDQMVVQVE